MRHSGPEQRQRQPAAAPDGLQRGDGSGGDDVERALRALLGGGDEGPRRIGVEDDGERRVGEHAERHDRLAQHPAEGAGHVRARAPAPGAER